MATASHRSGLGWLYEKGWGVNQDFKQARRLYAQAAGNSLPEVAKLGKEYFSNVPDSPGPSPDRTTISSSNDSSDFLAKVILGVIVIGGAAALTSSGPSDSQPSGSISSGALNPRRPPNPWEGVGFAGGTLLPERLVRLLLD